MGLDERLKYAEMKARHKKVLRPWYRKWWGVLIIVIMSFILILLVISGLYLNEKIKEILSEQEALSLEQQKQDYLSAVRGHAGNFSLGAAEPIVTIIEFGDFSCSFCAQSAAGFRQVAKKYPNQVKIVWRDYPLISADSVILALAARCAGEQGKFWEYHDLLFANQDSINSSDSNEEFGQLLESLAQESGISVQQFNTCLDYQTYLDRINLDYQDAENLDLSGTPTWFINDYHKITGALSEEKLDELVRGFIK
ncbi:MAG: thioredoxin domain-containing protein [Patescibacteria group bacterium]|jgi:protein-disulfide isomerase